MDLGLGNLIGLKRNLLAASLQETTDYDVVIAEIGKGVAASFDKFCNRKFARAVGDSCTFPANLNHFYLPRFPVESISSIAQKDSEDTGFEDIGLASIQNRNDSTGFIFFGATMGHWFSSIRVTYTGGFWFDTSEDEDGELPEGATLLPDDVKLAWVLQCRQVWAVIDKLGTGITGKASGGTLAAQNLGCLELVPGVKQMLQPYVRYQLT